jgi:protein tyrosine/serine phosphatase
MRLLPLLLFLLLAACVGTRVVDRDADGRPILLCGPQPDQDTLRKLHDRYGLRTVVNLRGENPDEAWYRRERNGVQEIGAKWIHLRTGSHEPPAPEHLARFFDIVEDPANWPVLVHCQSGIHRSGLMCALYRIQYQGWTGDEAAQEMVKHGFRLGGDRNAVEEFVRGYEPDPKRAISRDTD